MLKKCGIFTNLFFLLHSTRNCAQHFSKSASISEINSAELPRDVQMSPLKHIDFT